MTARKPIFRNPDDVREIRSFMLFGAIGAGAKGFKRGSARVGVATRKQVLAVEFKEKAA